MEAPEIVARALLMYLWNEDGKTFAACLEPADDPAYLAMKESQWNTNPIRAISLLDQANFKLVVELALERYGASASMWVQSA